MKEKQAVSLETLNGLLSERERYEQWLAALETRRANTSDSVYHKVRTDYETRLKEVSERLASRAGELRSSIEDLTQKLKDLAGDESAQRDSMQEAELRAAVGEYTEDEWRRIRQESEKELTRVAKDRTATETRLAELNRVFAMSAGGPVTSAPIPLRVTTPAPPAAPTQASQPAKSSASGWPQRDGDQPPTASASDSTGSESTGTESPFEEFASLNTATSTKSPPAAAPATSNKSRRGGLPDMRTEQQKTLKCPECGASNYPTEWYCERCGGELATL